MRFSALYLLERFMSEQDINMIRENSSFKENEVNAEQDNPPPQEIPSVPSLQSINSMAIDPKEQKQEEEELQVVQNRSGKRINHEEIMRMFKQQVEKEERERGEIQLKRLESFKSRSKNQSKPIAKKTSTEDRRQTKQNEQLRALSEKSTRIRKQIEGYCKKYKSMYRPSIYDTKVNRYRFECKEKLFFYLCYGIDQLREMSQFELSPLEREIVTQDAYDYCRKMVFVVDLEMLKILNKNDRHEVSREYKGQWETLLNNIREETNLELKRKILNRSFVPQKIAIASDIDFFTAAKREEILEKQKRYIAQFTVENVLKPFEKENDEIIEAPRPDSTEIKEEAPQLKTQNSRYANKYLDQSSIMQLQQLLSQSQLNKMLCRLQEDLQGRSQVVLIANFRETFKI